MTPPRKQNLETLEAGASDGPALSIPAGADITAKFKTAVDTSTLNESPRARPYSNELDDLAAEEFPDTPPDPLSEFIDEWGRFTGYPLKMVRLPDPAPRRIPGHTYNRACFELEQLSDMPFDPVNLVGSIQLVNGNSGGVFRLWLTEETGIAIPGARLDRIAIADPPKQYGQDPRSDPRSDPRYEYRREPAKPEPSALEARLQDLQEKLLSNALARLMEPPPAPAPPPGSTINDEDRLTLLLVKEGGILNNVVGKIAALVGAPETAAAKETWQERGINAALRLAETNPAIVERVSSTLERIVERILPASPRQRSPFQDERQPPQRMPPPQLAAPTGLPEAPQPEDDPEDEDILDILEELIAVLTSADALTPTHPVFIQLQQDYPLKFGIAVKLLASQSTPAIVAWIADKSPLYAAMFESPATGEFYRQRLAELQALCRAPAPGSAPAPETQTIKGEQLDNAEETKETPPKRSKRARQTETET